MRKRLITGKGRTIEDSIVALQDKAESWALMGYYPSLIPTIFTEKKGYVAVALLEADDD